MGYSYVFIGDLKFGSAEQKSAWAASTLDGSAFDTPDDWALEESGGSAADAFAAFVSEVGAVDQGATDVKLRAIVDKSGDPFLEGRQPLVCAFRQAAAFGGEGALTVVGYVDYPGSFGFRVTVAKGTSTCEELDAEEVAAVEKSRAHREADQLVQKLVRAQPFDAKAFAAKLAAEEEAKAATIREARDMNEVLERLPATLPDRATYREQRTIPESRVVAALVGRRDADASARMLARLRTLVGEEKFRTDLDMREEVEAMALAHALHRRGEARDFIVRIWLEFPKFFLRDHESVRKLGDPQLDARLASMLGRRIDAAGSDNHRFIADALFASDPEGAAERTAKLLEARSAADLESLRWIVGGFYEHPERRSPAWEALVRRIATEGEYASSAYDMYNQIRDNAIGVLALWKLPDALPLIRARFDRLGAERACELLVAIGEPGAIPVLEEALAKAKRKPDRSLIEHALGKLRGEEKKPVSDHVIEVSPSGRAGCRGCKEKIQKGELRFGEAAKNVFSDGGEPTMRWYHLRCAAEKKPKLLGPALAAYPGEVPDRASLEATIAEKQTKKPKKK